MWKLLLAGSLLPLAFAPLHYAPLAFIGLFILFNTWLQATPKKAFIAGWIFGMGFFGVGVSWVFVSIHQYGHTNIPLAFVITTLFIAFLALFPAIQGFVIKWLYRYKPKACLLIAFPTSWVLIEWLRSWLFTGFPWLYLGYSQLNTPLAWFAPVVGVYGVSFLVVLSTSLAMLIGKSFPLFTIKKSTLKLMAIVILTAIWFVGNILQKINWTVKDDLNPHTISLIQGNLSPDDKFALTDPIQAAIETYLDPTMQHLGKQFIIWPENSVTLSLPQATPFINTIGKLAKENKMALILGLPVEIQTNPYEFYNTLLAIGTAQGTYHKKILVPFGEYLPLEHWLRGLINLFDIPMSNFISGPNLQPPLITPNSKLLPLICYEIAYPEQVRKGSLEQQSNAIITISEDGWFGKSWGPHQHLDIARMRALENGRYVIRSTTSGISAIIDAKGKIIKQSPQFKPYVLSGEFWNYTGITPWTKYGELPIILFCGLLLILFSIVLKH